MRLFQVVVLFLLVMLPFAAVLAAEPTIPPPVTARARSAAILSTIPARLSLLAVETTESGAVPPAAPGPLR